jgi:ADP-ribose pyrophosphatase YjhB (NUDIX family)
MSHDSRLIDLVRQQTGNFNQYKYCPRCRAELAVSQAEGNIRPHCEKCGFVYYLNPAPAAGAIIIDEHQRILLVQRAFDPRAGDWCIPAGFLEWTESPRQCAVREIEEETGLVIKLTGIFDVFFARDDPRTHAVLILYDAEIIGGELKAGDDAEEARYFDFDHLPSNIAFQAHREALALIRQKLPET